MLLQRNGHDCLEGGIDPDLKGTLAYRLPEAFGDVEIIERDDPSHFRLDPENLRVVGGFRHGKEADGIGAQQDIRCYSWIISAASPCHAYP